MKLRLQELEGTALRKQQLVHGSDILVDTSCLAELSAVQPLELRLVRKEAISFQWQATPRGSACLTSPEWCVESEAASRCPLSLQYYPVGFESSSSRPSKERLLA